MAVIRQCRSAGAVRGCRGGGPRFRLGGKVHLAAVDRQRPVIDAGDLGLKGLARVLEVGVQHLGAVGAEDLIAEVGALRRQCLPGGRQQRHRLLPLHIVQASAVQIGLELHIVLHLVGPLVQIGVEGPGGGPVSELRIP